LTIRTSDRAFINWQSFNIGVGETTTFLQPSSSSLVWNRINDSNPSQILGNLNANGYVVLQNSSGFYIGGQAAITTHGLLMTTAPIQMPELSSGGPWQFNAPPPTAKIINYGHLDVGQGGSAFLISNEIENHGSISAPGGEIGLYAGKQVLLSQRPDGRGLSARVTLPQGSVSNDGELIADAGTIAMHAQVVNQGGLVQANSVREVNGTIELIASDAVNLGPGSVIQAKGDSQGVSPGGAITIKSGGTFTDASGSTLDVSGGAQGGNGGRLELSAASLAPINSTINAAANKGFHGGSLLLDPYDLTLDSTFISSLSPILNGDGLFGIELQADHNITLSTLWTLNDPGTPALLSLTAGNNIIFNDNAAIKAGRNWSVTMFAGPQGLSSRPASGTGGIYLNGGSYIETQNGDINLWAANDIIVNADYSLNPGFNGIRTVAGGNITVTAQYGDVNSGASQLGASGTVNYFGNINGFLFGRNAAPYYAVSPNLGGISTAAGGNVTITAGRDVVSFTPIQTGNPDDYLAARNDAGSGAFGPQPGNVTITAGGNVFGHYVLANGVGSITAHGNIGVPVINSDGTSGDPTRGFALSVIKGDWTVHADGSIYVQDVRNPNGVFGERTSRNLTYAGYHFFDYDPQDSIRFDGYSVEITGLDAPHLPLANQPQLAIPLIFPASLHITTGAGGFVMDQSVTLFPSPSGDLDITTHDGGDFIGVHDFNDRSALTMAEGGSTLWNSGARPVIAPYAPGVESGNPTPVEITVSGSLKDVDIVTTKETHLTVGKDEVADMVDVGFSAQNLHPGDSSWINVNGNIVNTPGLNFVNLNAALVSANPYLPNDWSSFFLWAVDPNVANVDTRTLGSTSIRQYITDNRIFPFIPGFVYDSSTHRLGFNGDMASLKPDLIYALTHPETVVVLDQNGQPIVDPKTGRIKTTTYTFVPTTDSYNPIADLQAASAGAPPNARANSGYVIGGPGQFQITAHSADLANTAGILSVGGAVLDVDLSGNLTMLTSRIASFDGGHVNVTSGGSIDLGTQNLFIPNPGNAYGIYTSGFSDVRVVAHDDININGSRIAAYNGGNVFVESDYGDVNVGSGGNTFANVPLVGGHFGSDPIFGSGILAVSLPAGYQTAGGGTIPGNITVNTPRGNIKSSEAGILQIALDGNVAGGPTVTLTAGTPASGDSPAIKGDIILGSSGLIGGTVILTAQGNIEGVIVSRQDSDIHAAQNFSGTLVAGGTANFGVGGNISGTIVAVGGIGVSSGSVSGATFLSQSVSVGGGPAQSTLGNSAGATVTSQAAAQQANSQAQEQVSSDNKEDEKKKGAKGPTITRRVGRVTVILPKSS
jgi:filamentous hemagglutinin family protein